MEHYKLMSLNLFGYLKKKFPIGRFKVLFSLLRIEKFCTVQAGTKVPCKEESTGQDIGGIVGGAVAAIIIVMVLISVATLSVLGFCFMLSKRKSSKTPEESKPE